MNVGSGFVVALCALLLLRADGRLDGQTDRPAEPIEPVRAVLNALQTHEVVGLGTGAHNNEQGHAFLMSLVAHAEFPATRTDLVVECGNARYQDVMDQFVRGEAIPYELLRRAWQDTTQPHAGCDVPLHEELYRKVRSVNASLPAGQRIRIVLGDPPIEWDSPTTKADRDKFMVMRDSYPAEAVRKEVLGNGRHALVVYGQMHLQRKQMASNYDMSHPLAQTIVSLLEGAGVNVFTVWGNSRADLESVQPDIAAWPRPSLALLRDTSLGTADFEFFYGLPMVRVALTEGKPSPVPRQDWLTLRMEDQFDAVLYLGPPSAMTTAALSASLCADLAYMKMRLGRLDSQGPKPEADQLRTYCTRALK
jgi:hypothetical protein